MAPPAVTSPIIAVCGLHGGAGTTTIATTLATHAVVDAGHGTVLLTETDPCGGGLALALDAASPYGLNDLAAFRATGAAPTDAPYAQLPNGLRITAAAPAERTAIDPHHVTSVLLDAGAAHALTVVDCGTIREPHRDGALAAATAVIWTASATVPAGLARRLTAGALARTARHLPWILAISDTTAHRERPPLSDLRAMVPDVRRVVLAPTLAGLPHDDPRRRDLARDLIEAL